MIVIQVEYQYIRIREGLYSEYIYVQMGLSRNDCGSQQPKYKQKYTPMLFCKMQKIIYNN